MVISLNPYDSRDRARIVERARLRGLASAAREARSELSACTVDLIHALQNLREIGVDKTAVLDAAAELHTAITNLDAAHRADIDAEAGPFGPLDPAEAIDLTELETIIEECRHER